MRKGQASNVVCPFCKKPIKLKASGVVRCEKCGRSLSVTRPSGETRHGKEVPKAWAVK